MDCDLLLMSSSQLVGFCVTTVSNKYNCPYGHLVEQERSQEILGGRNENLIGHLSLWFSVMRAGDPWEWKFFCQQTACRLSAVPVQVHEQRQLLPPCQIETERFSVFL